MWTLNAELLYRWWYKIAFRIKCDYKRYAGVGSIWRCQLTSIGNPIVEIRRFYDRLIYTKGFPILVRWYFYIESGPWFVVLDVGEQQNVHCANGRLQCELKGDVPTLPFYSNLKRLLIQLKWSEACLLSPKIYIIEHEETNPWIMYHIICAYVDMGSNNCMTYTTSNIAGLQYLIGPFQFILGR